MSKPNKTLATWQRLAAIPGGKWAFSRLVCWRAPYFASIRPLFEVLRPGRSEVRMPKRHAVLNHIGTVHAIAMCNLAELAAGTMTDSTVPPTHRWIPKGMTVEYLRKAETSLRAVATLAMPAELAAPTSLSVTVNIMDSGNETVMRATINMWVSPQEVAVYSAAFIFEPGHYDDEFHRLNDEIATVARSSKGYLGQESWQSADGTRRNATYYWASLEDLRVFSSHPAHLEAKRQYSRWYKGYHIVISQVVRSYGDDAFIHVTPNERDR